MFDSILNTDLIPFIGSKSVNKNGNNEPNDEAMNHTFNFMRGIMDECTHLGNFSVPVDPELAIIVNATNDGYVPRNGIQALTDLWPGSTARYVDGGHVSAILFNTNVFRYVLFQFYFYLNFFNLNPIYFVL